MKRCIQGCRQRKCHGPEAETNLTLPTRRSGAGPVKGKLVGHGISKGNGAVL